MSKKNLPKIVVITDISPLDTPDMISAGLAVKTTGDADAGACTVTDTTLHTEANALQTVHTKRGTNPPTATAKDETVARDTLAEDYQFIASYVQGIANKVAKTAGDVAAGIIVVERTGFKLKSKTKAKARVFEVFDDGIAWAHVRTKAAAKYAAYVWQYGITDKKGNPPPVLGRGLVNLEANIKITNLQSGKIYGIQVGVVLRTKNPTHSDGEDPVIFSDFIYFVVK